MLWTCDPAIVKQLFTVPTVQLPVDVLRFYDIWGPTIGSVEGEEWKNHRKIISYGLNSINLPGVWKETIHQTRTLIGRWEEDNFVVEVAKEWTSRLALHVISSVFFDHPMDWSEYETDSNSKLPGGFQMTFDHALFHVIESMAILFMLPRKLLRFLPFKATQQADIAFKDLTKYMKELRQKAKDKIEEVAAKRHKNLVESIVVAGTPGISGMDAKPLSEESVLGNLYFTLMAGHETAGNTLAFTLLLLAVYPEYQRSLQKELDEQLGDRKPEKWTIENDYPALQNGYTGAVLKESMRTHNMAQFVFRLTVAPTTFRDSNGVEHTVPVNTMCMINIAAAFNNPSTWTPKDVSVTRRAELHHSQAIDFDPCRWLADGENGELPFTWPFGYGLRKCPGKPFAETEMVAFLATLFKDYSVELVVDEKILVASRGDSKLAWERTRDDAMRRLKDDVEPNLTLQMLKKMPIQLVKRE